MKRLFKLMFIQLVLVSCTTIPGTTSKILVVPIDEPAFVEAKFSAQTCENPITARMHVSRNFKYGCFCGAGYPDIRAIDGKKFSELNDYERSRLVESYYKIRPVDDIDAACQAHDICWTMNDSPQLACNDAFVETLKTLREGWSSQYGFFSSDKWQARCTSLALDLELATSLIMDFKKDGSKNSASTQFTRLIFLPATAFIAAGTTLIGATFEKAYPAEFERCYKELHK